jgi:hypothetical protein
VKEAASTVLQLTRCLDLLLTAKIPPAGKSNHAAATNPLPFTEGAVRLRMLSAMPVGGRLVTERMDPPAPVSGTNSGHNVQNFDRIVGQLARKLTADQQMMDVRLPSAQGKFCVHR